MRNLKKFFALVLAMVMALSLMLTANAASKYDQVKGWSDKDQVTEEFTKAVDVLSGMEVFQGDDDGGLRPGDSITRAEVAALIYRLGTGDVGNEKKDLYTTIHPFTDVNESDWFSGYVGYCWNAGYIKGTTATIFNPYDNVTGYEVLAMVLRAMGYDQNDEFTGTQWILHVSSTATQRNLLDDVKSAHYDSTLHLASRRDVVASILFHAATEATVEYTPAFGYQTTHYSGSTTSAQQRVDNPSLGEMHFNLTKVEGIVVGNQDTGESYTRINSAKEDMADHVAYFHQTTNFDENGTAVGPVETTDTATIDAKTGIDMFGHKVEAWYNNSAISGYKTFALYDNVVKTAVVTSSDAVLSNSAWATRGDAALGEAAQAAGFSVDLTQSKAVFNQDFGVSGSVSRITAAGQSTGESDYADKGANATVGSANSGVASTNVLGQDSNTAYPLYLLISNNKNNTVDMVVALNLNVSRVTQVNNYASYPTVTVPLRDNTQATVWNKQANDMIHQTALTATSDKELGTPVVGVAITGTNAADVKTVCTAGTNTEVNGFTAPATSPVNSGATAKMFYRLSKPTQYVEGTVTNFNYTGKGANQHTGSIVINGQRIERSYLADAIADYDSTVSPAVPANRGIQGNKAVNLSATANLYGNYRAYLDSEGKYIWIEPIYESTFVYGTYIDYSTPYGSSAYEYTLVGVDLNGEMVQRVVKTINGSPINKTNYKTIAPSRDGEQSLAGVTPLSYIGYLISEDGDLTTATGAAASTAGKFETISPEVNQAGYTDSTTRGILTETDSEAWTVTSTDARLGTKMLTSGGAAQGGNTYFTNETKFIVVDGAGTDTQKVEVYNGMSELLKGGSRVKISGDNALTAAKTYLAATTDSLAGLEYNQQMYFTSSPLAYASVNGNNPMKVDTIIIPKLAITWTGTSDLYFVGNPAQDSEIRSGNNTYHLYTMYLNGEPGQYWLMNSPTGTTPGTDDPLVKDSFYKLYPTSKKTPTGETVYVANDGTTTTATTAAGVVQSLDSNQRPNLVVGANPMVGSTASYYEAATYASQTAIVGTVKSGAVNTASGGDSAIFNVSDAKVVNLNSASAPAPAGLVWPGITDLAALNDAASTALVYGNARPKVCVQVDPTNNLNITVIYVCWDQN